MARIGQCFERVAADGGWGMRNCGNAGKFEENGYLWCRVHVPSTVHAKNKAKNDAWDEMRARETTRHEPEARARRYAAFEPMQGALQALVDHIRDIPAAFESERGQSDIEAARAALRAALAYIEDGQ
jgi:hypothetical protein